MADKSFKYNFVIDILQTGIPLLQLALTSNAMTAVKLSTINNVNKSFIDILNANKSYGTKTGAVINGLTRFGSAQAQLNSSLMLVVNRLGAFGVAASAAIIAFSYFSNKLKEQAEYVKLITEKYDNLLKEAMSLFYVPGTDVEEQIKKLQEPVEKLEKEINNEIDVHKKRSEYLKKLVELYASLQGGVGGSIYSWELGIIEFNHNRKMKKLLPELEKARETLLKYTKEAGGKLSVATLKKIAELNVRIALQYGDTEKVLKLRKQILDDDLTLTDEVRNKKKHLLDLEYNATKAAEEKAKNEFAIADANKHILQWNNENQALLQAQIKYQEIIGDVAEAYKLKVKLINDDINISKQLKEQKIKNLEAETAKTLTNKYMSLFAKGDSILSIQEMWDSFRLKDVHKKTEEETLEVNKMILEELKKISGDSDSVGIF